MRSYFSPGKIMLCGEYAVTIGVEALAVPTDVGQWMHVWEFDSPAGGDRLIWEAKEKDGSTWLNDSFALPLVMDQDQSEKSGNEPMETAHGQVLSRNDLLERLLASRDQNNGKA
jgi:hypothetical protein